MALIIIISPIIISLIISLFKSYIFSSTQANNQLNCDFHHNDDHVYKMSSIPTGFCVIINIINFNGREHLKRDGSEESVRLIKEAFEYNLFNALLYCDLTDDQILNEINELVKCEQCKEHDAFVLYIHTHGVQDTILCSNNRTLHFHEILNLFRDENCEYLTNKPKLIFFDCCREGNSVNKNSFNNCFYR